MTRRTPHSLLVCLLAACGGSATTTTHATQDDPASARDASAPDADASLPATPDAGHARDAGHDAAIPTDPLPTGERRRVILMIGDGMGPGQLEAASLFAYGAPGRLTMQSLPQRGQIRTGGPSGITDSAAAATVMATGTYTYNGYIGVDRDGRALETLVELAQAEGLATGLVSTALLPHATPAAFSAHDPSRADYVAIADDQVRDARADVMLGGGARYFFGGAGSARTDAGLEPLLSAGGYTVVRTREELFAAPPEGPLFGVFAPEHMTFTRERATDSAEPTLEDMSMAALARLGADPRGFFLMIEGARIDMASHLNDLPNAVGETLAFDETVAAVAEWARSEGDVTLIVTADHECGGLSVVTPKGEGVLPDVSWRWLNHTNARVDVFAEGPGSELFGGALRDHRSVHALARARLTGEALVEPQREPIPDGHLEDLRHEAARQTLASSFDPTRTRLDALRVDASERGLFVGIEGLFTWERNAVVVLLDTDFGADTGYPGLRGALSDVTGAVDAVLAGSRTTSNIPGFGADFAVASLGGADPQLGELLPNGGLRGLRAPYGKPDDLGWYNAAINYGEDVRTRAPSEPAPGEGLELFIPWQRLYPPLDGRVPPGARVALAALLVNGDGGYTSNQLLPPLASGALTPAREDVALPAVVVFPVDANGDGIADGDTAPTLAN